MYSGVLYSVGTTPPPLEHPPQKSTANYDCRIGYPPPLSLTRISIYSNDNIEFYKPVSKTDTALMTIHEPIMNICNHSVVETLHFTLPLALF